ncbi:putative sphingosine-1-phosphate lyase-like [Penaeus vannamei]|uniref:Putative sphingosine-1-phosphate lyase-like n=1 Tax=Penaeus vannamei TaxID=6689 RepID=A0A3R7QLN9_PENVA|nr:putative sphingosine-1-phosphate lyase-like [Penaeus vannamei]
MESLKLGLTGVEAALERWTEGREKWQVVAGSATLTLAAMALGNLYANRADVKDDVRAWVFRVLRSIPPVKRYIQKQLDQSRKGNYAWQDGKISGGAFSGSNDDLSEVLLKVYGMTALTNPLHADMFPGVRKMEAEIVRMSLSLFHGDEEACDAWVLVALVSSFVDGRAVGEMTSGGSESILMAMKAMRDWGREVKGVKQAEVVMSVTGHSAFDKSASLLGMKIRKGSGSYAHHTTYHALSPPSPLPPLFPPSLFTSRQRWLHGSIFIVFEKG